MENRKEQIEKLFIDKNPLTIDEFKAKIDIELFELLVKIEYISIHFETTSFFEVTEIDKLSELAVLNTYYNNSKEVSFYDEMYSTDYGRYNWGYLFIKFNDKIYQILHGYDASS